MVCKGSETSNATAWENFGVKAAVPGAVCAVAVLAMKRNTATRLNVSFPESFGGTDCFIYGLLLYHK
jgi:hypothetical protein